MDASLPFSLDENDCFREMIKSCNQDISVPSRQSVTRKIPKLHDLCEITVKDLLKEIPVVIGTSTDSWSSRISRGYLSMTLSWVDKECVLRHVLLDSIPFEMPYNRSTTSSVVMKLLTHWNLTGNLRAQPHIMQATCVSSWRNCWTS